MEKSRHNLTPLVTASLLLLLPVLYVGSYFVLVVRRPTLQVSLTFPTQFSADYYQLGGDYAEAFYWPLEQIDRKLQPDAWVGNDGFHICNGR